MRLADAPARLSAEDLVEVVVEVPGQGPIRPWRYMGPGDVAVSADGRTITI